MEVSVFSAWSELPESALQRLDCAGRYCPFSGRSWFALFSREVAERGFEPCWLMLGDGQLLLPMMRDPRRRKKTLRSLSNYYSPYFSLAGDGQHDGAALRRLFGLARSTLRGFDSIEFFPLTADTARTFREAAATLGFCASTTIQTWNWRQPGIDDFEHYWASRDSRLRNTVQRKLRKLQSMGGFEFSVAGDADIEQTLSDYRKVYDRSWKTDENYPDFIDGLIRMSAGQGMLRMGFVRHEGIPVAAQLWLVHGRTAYIYKLAYDERYKATSVGTLLTHYLFRHVIEADRVRTVDYLTGDDAYKAQWMEERRALYRLTLSNPRRPRGALQALEYGLRRRGRGLPGEAQP